MSSRDRFYRSVAIVIAIAGLIWLALTLFNVWQGGSFSWSGLGVFILALAALYIARGRAGR